MTCAICGVPVLDDEWAYDRNTGFICMVCSSIKMKRALKFLEEKKYKDYAWQTFNKKITRAKVRRSVKALGGKAE